MSENEKEDKMLRVSGSEQRLSRGQGEGGERGREREAPRDDASQRRGL